MVIAIPLALVIEGNHEQILSLQRFHRLFAVILARHSIAQWAAQSVENRGLQQEIADPFTLALQHFLDEIVQHKTVATGESLHKTAGVCLPLHGKGGHLQTGNPAFGSGIEGGDLFAGESESPHLVEQCCGFGKREAQVGSAQLKQLAAHAIPGQRERWIFPRREDQVHLRGQVLQQKAEDIVNRS